jgi:hypothetical protein
MEGGKREEKKGGEFPSLDWMERKCKEGFERT